MNTILSINQLSKNYGKLKAVDQLSLEVQKGQVFGILGPNGSGKTTTLGMVLNVIAPNSGSYSWFGSKPSPEARRKIGSILETPSFFPYMTALENLKVSAHIKGCGTRRLEETLKICGLLDRKNDKFKNFSLGMKQRLSIASALIANPPVLILDEPTNGLDPEGIAEVRTLIREIAADGKTIIVASHLLDEVQKICTHFCVIRKGKKLHEGRVDEALGEINKIELAADDNHKLQSCLTHFNGIQDVWSENSSLFVSLSDQFTAQDLNSFCFDQGIVLKKLLTHHNSLENEFLKILKEND